MVKTSCFPFCPEEKGRWKTNVLETGSFAVVIEITEGREKVPSNKLTGGMIDGQGSI